MREHQGKGLGGTAPSQGQSIDDLERITKLWQAGALTDDPDWNDGEKPERNKAAVYGAWALILAAAPAI